MVYNPLSYLLVIWLNTIHQLEWHVQPVEPVRNQACDASEQNAINKNQGVFFGHSRDSKQLVYGSSKIGNG